jgi:hypothetical protein
MEPDLSELSDEQIARVLEELDGPKTKKQSIDEFEDDTFSTVRLTDISKALKMEWPSTAIIAGATGTGKTMLMINLIYANARNFNRIFLLSPIADDPIYDFIPKKYRISNPSDVDLQNILQEQHRKRYLKTLIICDDCIGKINFDRGNISKMITTTGRHFNLSFIIVMQYLNNIHPIIRDNAKVLFVTKLKTHCLDSIVNLTSCFSGKTQCRNFLNDACRNFQIVRFNLTGYQDTDEVMVFKNRLPRKFILNF